MAELLAWDGPWSPKVIRAMLPKAMLAEVDASARQFAATSAAIAGIWRGGARPYVRALQELRAKCGGSVAGQSVEEVREMFGKAGMKPRRRGKK